LITGFSKTLESKFWVDDDLSCAFTKLIGELTDLYSCIRAFELREDPTKPISNTNFGTVYRADVIQAAILSDPLPVDPDDPKLDATIASRCRPVTLRLLVTGLDQTEGPRQRGSVFRGSV